MHEKNGYQFERITQKLCNPTLVSDSRCCNSVIAKELAYCYTNNQKHSTSSYYDKDNKFTRFAEIDKTKIRC